jgi:hypothetical protein
MPLRKKATKGKTKVKATVVKQAQNVRQSVKVVIEAPKRRAPRRPAKPTQSDMLKGLMRAPEYTTFRDLTPAAPSTGYGQAPPQYPINNAPQQQRVDQQDNVGSVSGSLSLLPQGQLPAPPERKALPAPKEEEKKSSEDEEENIIVSGAKPYNPRQDQTLEELRLSSNEYQLRMRAIRAEEKEKKKQEEKARQEAFDERNRERRERTLMTAQDINAFMKKPIVEEEIIPVPQKAIDKAQALKKSIIGKKNKKEEAL